MTNFTQNINNSLVSYRGIVSSEIIALLVSETEGKIRKVISNRNTEKKIVIISIELLQNLFHYTKERLLVEDLEKTSAFSVSKKESYVEIYSGNYIKSDDVTPFKTRLDNINSLTKDELKAFYISSLQNTGIKQNNNVSLGLIDIARRSGNPLKFEFEKKDKNLFYFHLTVKVDF